MVKELRTFSELIEDINESLAEWDGDALADIANEILAKKVEYNEDSMFEVSYGKI